MASLRLHLTIHVLPDWIQQQLCRTSFSLRFIWKLICRYWVKMGWFCHDGSCVFHGPSFPTLTPTWAWKSTGQRLRTPFWLIAKQNVSSLEESFPPLCLWVMPPNTEEQGIILLSPHLSSQSCRDEDCHYISQLAHSACLFNNSLKHICKPRNTGNMICTISF